MAVKPNDQLTYPGQLARHALAEYGLEDAPFKFVIAAGNILWRVYDPRQTAHPVNSPAEDDLFASGQYLLRMHQPGYQDGPGIQLELLELFMAASRVYWRLWAVGGTQLYPQYLEMWQERMHRSARLIREFVSTQYMLTSSGQWTAHAHAPHTINLP